MSDEDTTDQGEAEMCPICHGDYNEESTPKVTLECNHSFHTGCIIRWFRTPINEGTCPMCRGVPVCGTSRMCMAQRCSYLRRRARAKNAPKDLKKRVERLQKMEKQIVEDNRAMKEFHRREDVKEILAMTRKLRRKRWGNWTRLRKAKAHVAIFQAPGYDPPGFVQDSFTRLNRRVRYY